MPSHALLTAAATAALFLLLVVFFLLRRQRRARQALEREPLLKAAKLEEADALANMRVLQAGFEKINMQDKIAAIDPTALAHGQPIATMELLQTLHALRGGDTGKGGDVLVTAGQTTHNTSAGGDVVVTAGVSTVGTKGGSVLLTCGVGSS